MYSFHVHFMMKKKWWKIRKNEQKKRSGPWLLNVQKSGLVPKVVSVQLCPYDKTSWQNFICDLPKLKKMNMAQYYCAFRCRLIIIVMRSRNTISVENIKNTIYYDVGIICTYMYCLYRLCTSYKGSIAYYYCCQSTTLRGRAETDDKPVATLSIAMVYVIRTYNVYGKTTPSKRIYRKRIFE